MYDIVNPEELRDPSHPETHLFAACNTADGFVSLFEETFSPAVLRKIYILKGGPGVGKSTLMKKAAVYAEKKGFHPHLYHCSSDPASLDGVIIPETGKAILDGTAPHIVEPTYPGARTELVPLGEAWDIPTLEKESERIIALSANKAACYRSAYRLLASAGNADGELRTMSESCLNVPKMRGALERLCTRHFKGKGGTLSHMCTTSYSKDGLVRLFTNEKKARFLYFVKDAHASAPFFFHLLAEMALRAGAETVSGLYPLDPTSYCALYFPNESVCVSLYDDRFARLLDRAEKPYKIINLGRFFDGERFAAFRGKYRFIEKCRSSLTEAASEEFKKAGALHGELEQIYGRATDYGVIEKMSARVIEAVCK